MLCGSSSSVGTGKWEKMEGAKYNTVGNLFTFQHSSKDIAAAATEWFRSQQIPTHGPLKVQA